MATANHPTKIGKYEILSMLGRGGMGVVYKARDPVIDRVVAIKTIPVGEEMAGDESLLERLHMEARSAGRLHHTNIVTVYDFGQQDELSYIVMEFVEGANLARLIDERHEIALDAKLDMLTQIADGLAYAHEHGVVHRDMKPSNVCVTAKGTAKILDFGLARFDNTRLTKTGYMSGTIAYMSPERFSGVTGVHDDIFALGAIAYELLTYQRAFPGATTPEVIQQIITPTAPPDPSEIADIPPEIDAIVQKALAKQVEQRYQSAIEFANDLRQYARSGALRDFLADERRSTIDRSVKEFVDVNRPSGHAYAGPSTHKRAADGLPTMGAAAPPLPKTEAGKTQKRTVVVPDVQATGVSTQPEVDLNAARTRIVPVASRRSRMWPAIAAVAILVISGVIWMTRRSAPPIQQQRVTPTVAQKHAPTPTATSLDELADKTEIELATARSMTEELARRTLTSDERVRFSRAKARLALAEKKINTKQYDTGGRLVADAITGLQGVMTTSEKRMQQTSSAGSVRLPAVTPPRQTLSQAKVSVTAPAPAPAPVPGPVPTPPPVALPHTLAPPVTAPVETRPAPQPQPVAAESPEKEIASFMRQLAAAYQAKDVGFFREHVLRFTDQLASAIRNSPSVRVELQITRFDIQDPQHVSVHVKRTDWFGDSGMPPATQALVYQLQRSGSGWEVASFSRD